MLDCGADGVLVPHVDSVKAAQQAVALARYRVARGFSPTTRAGKFGASSADDHMMAQDARVAVIAMIEDAAALFVIEDIVAVEGLDAIFVGRADLAASMAVSGCDGGVGRAVARILAAATARKLPLMLLAANPAEVTQFRGQGVSAFLTGSDQGFLKASAAMQRSAFFP